MVNEGAGGALIFMDVAKGLPLCHIVGVVEIEVEYFPEK